jgi:hypothetical protein
MSSSFESAGTLHFPRMLGFYECFQAIQAGTPETAVLFEPRVYRTQRLGVQPINAQAAFAMLADEMCAAQQAQVLGDGRAGDGKGARDLSGRLAAAAQEIENGAAGGIGQGLERGLGRSSAGRSGFRGSWTRGARLRRPVICNRTVTHDA